MNQSLSQIQAEVNAIMVTSVGDNALVTWVIRWLFSSN